MGRAETLNLADHFLDARVREGLGAKEALRFRERRFSYEEVQRASNRAANALRAAGALPEERVLLALPDGPELVAAIFGALRLGAVAVMVNPALRDDELAYLLEHTRARAWLVCATEAARLAGVARAATQLRAKFVVGGDAHGFESWEGALARASDRADTFLSHPDDAAIWLFSGGTTGRPKAVVQSHASFANTTRLYAQNTMGYRVSDVTLSVPKLFFGYATGSNLFFPFSVGGTAILFDERPTADVLFRLIREHRPTILVNVPTFVNQMLSHPEARAQDLSCLRFATSAGEALPAELHARWMDTFGVPLLDGLGTAEMWHIFVTNRPGDVRPGTLGRVVEGFELRVCDDEGRDVGADEVGALWVRGGSRAIGYWQDMARSAMAFRGEWYVSGDLVRRDADGYVTYCGRGDDLLKVGGKWVAPEEVENCLLQHASVVECALVGVPSADGLVKPHAFVVARARVPGLEEELREFVCDRLAPYKAPRVVHLMDTLPRTHLGKVDRGHLRRLA
jgi:benzoate-CoA ligase family protein